MLAGGVAAASAGPFSARSVNAQEAMDDRWPCIGMNYLPSVPEDERLGEFSIEAMGVAADPDGTGVSGVRFDWRIPADAEVKCIWAHMRPPGRDYTNLSEFIIEQPAFEGSFVHYPGAVEIRGGVGVGGEYCYLVAALSSEGRSAVSELCLAVPNPRVPEDPFADAPGSNPTPGAPSVGSGSGGSRIGGVQILAVGVILLGLATFVVPRLRGLPSKPR